MISAPEPGAVTTSTSLVSRRMVYANRMKKKMPPSGVTFFSSAGGGRADRRRASGPLPVCGELLSLAPSAPACILTPAIRETSDGAAACRRSSGRTPPALAGPEENARVDPPNA
eukprot:scaffold24068_cov101-Isochrysis_galbana.AAC.1